MAIVRQRSQPRSSFHTRTWRADRLGFTAVLLLALLSTLSVSPTYSDESPARPATAVQLPVTSPPGTPPTGSICKKHTSCECEFANGSVVSLASLANKAGQAPRFDHVLSPHDHFYYFWNPCVPFSVGNPDSGSPTDRCKDVAACQQWYDYYSDLGYQSSSSANFNEDHNGFYIHYQGQADEHAPSGRSLFVYLRCEPGRSTAIFEPYGDVDRDKVYVYEVRHSSLCPYVPSSSQSISIGTIMCITALLLVIAYLVGGVLIMKLHKKAEGREIIPNYTLWAGFPELIKDGALFIREKISGPSQPFKEVL